MMSKSVATYVGVRTERYNHSLSALKTVVAAYTGVRIESNSKLYCVRQIIVTAYVVAWTENWQVKSEERKHYNGKGDENTADMPDL